MSAIIGTYTAVLYLSCEREKNRAKLNLLKASLIRVRQRSDDRPVGLGGLHSDFRATLLSISRNGPRHDHPLTIEPAGGRRAQDNTLTCIRGPLFQE